MRKLLLSMIAVVFCISAFAQQTQVIQLSAAENKLELKGVTPEHFRAKVQVKELQFENKTDVNGEFSTMGVYGMVKPNNVGQASLPVISKLIEVPYGAEIQVVINGYDEQVISLSDYGISRIEPTQPSYSKSTPVEEQYFVIDNDYYNTDELESAPLVSTEISGIMRGVRIGYVQIRPYRYNPVENTLTVYNNLDFEISFVNADLVLTEEMKNRYYTPELEGTYETLLNYIAPAAKDATSNYAAPLKYVIVANTAFQSALQPFVQWKTKQGFNVIEHYVATGTTNTTIKTYLQGLYNAGTASDPAPLYLLIVGDHSGTYAIPSFASQNTGSGGTDHISDLYFATLSGSDYIPDMYYGRISAESITELSNAMDKIIPYEKYTIANGSYLNNCVMIAGVDASNAHTFGDAQILYGINNYYNTAHGFTNVWAYFYNNSTNPYNVMASSNSGAEASIISKIQTGVGFANYTAHCSDDGWSDPTIANSDILSFNNEGKYPFMIGNCCQSFMFNSSDAFGEILLYTAKEGAVGYIGASQYSYWYEDAWWGMGNTTLTLNSTNWASHTYANTGIGVYDGIWHENGEAYSNWYYTGSQIVQRGNLAVQASTSGYKQYYWEIYHCVGDPSLMPYSTEPDALSLSFPNPMQGATSLTVTTEAYTYVAISKNNVLLDAEWSGNGTSVTLTVPAFSGETYTVVGTKQDRSPYINENVVPTAANPPVADFSGTPLTILEGQSVSFTDASQYPASWAWNFGDTQTSTLQNPVHVYSTAGIYTVSLTVSNGLGSDTETKTGYITVNPNTNPPTADFTADVTTVTVGGTVNFTDLSIDNPASWSWSFDGGTPATSTNQNPSVVYNTAGTYQVVLTATNSYGSDTETKLAYITVNTPDYCTAGSTNSSYEYISKVVCNTINNSSSRTTYSDFTAISTNLTIGSTYTVTVTNGSTSYSSDQCLIWADWNRDGDFVDAGENILSSSNGVGPYSTGFTVPASATAGNVRVRVRIHDTSDGPNATPCGTSTYGEVEDYTFVLVAPVVVPVADFSANNTSGCGTLAVQFTDLSTGTPTSWAWNFGDSQTSTLQNPSHTYSAPGNYTVTLTATNTAGSDAETKTAYIVVNSVPAAVVVTGGGTQCGGSMILNATGGTGGTIYWQNTTNNGTSTATASSSQTVSTNGTYYFRAQSAAGCWGTQGSASVTINAVPADVTVTGGGTQCGGSMTLNATGGTGGTIYWQNTTNNGTSIATASASQSVSATGTYYFRSRSAAGCWGNQGSASVEIYPSFTANAVATDESSTGATDGSITVTMTGGTAPFSGAWTPSGTTNTSGTSMTLNGLTGGNYSVVVEDANGCTANASATVNTLGSAPVAAFSADITGGCDNLTVNFTDLSNNTPTSWAWNFGDGQTSTQQNPVHAYSAAGTYTVVLTVGNLVGSDSETMTDYIVVGETPVISMGMTEETVVGNDGTVTAGVTGGSTPYNYVWNVPGTSETLTGLAAGEYCVTVTEDNGCQASDCITLTQETVLNPPVADFETDLTTGCETLTVQFTDLSTNNPTSWAWTFGDGGVSAEQNPEHIYSASGTYTVTLTVTNADGSDDEVMTDMIYVGTAPEVSVDVVHASGESAEDGSATVVITGGTAPFEVTWSTSATGNVINNLLPGNYSVMVVDDAGCIVTEPFVVSWTSGISENVYTFSIFPNPAKDIVTVSLEGIVADNIQVTNAIGQSIMTINPESTVTNIDLRNFEAGIYFIKVYVDGKEFVNKLVIN